MTDRRRRMHRLALALGLFATFPGAWILQRVRGHVDIPVCFFRTITGRPCPFCGLTRAFGHATHGEWDAAFAAHSLWWVAALAVVALALASLLDAATGTDRMALVRRAWHAYGWYAIALVAAIALFG